MKLKWNAPTTTNIESRFVSNGRCIAKRTKYASYRCFNIMTQENVTYLVIRFFLSHWLWAANFQFVIVLCNAACGFLCVFHSGIESVARCCAVNVCVLLPYCAIAIWMLMSKYLQWQLDACIVCYMAAQQKQCLLSVLHDDWFGTGTHNATQ